MRRHGFTLIELLVVVAIIVALLAILLPSMNRAIEVAQRAACLSNQHQISIGVLGYAADHFGHYPHNKNAAPFAMTGRSGWAGGWFETRTALNPYVSAPEVFYCPAGGVSPTAPTINNYQTFTINAGSGGWYKLAGWEAIPYDVPADYYVHIDYAIFPGFVMALPGAERMRMILAPDAEITEVASNGINEPMIPNRVGAPTPYGSGRTPMTADTAYVDRPISLAVAYNGEKAIWDDPYVGQGSTTYMKAHLGGGGFEGLGVSFLDGHAEWRGKDIAGPRLGTPATLRGYGYVLWY